MLRLSRGHGSAGRRAEFSNLLPGVNEDWTYLCPRSRVKDNVSLGCELRETLSAGLLYLDADRGVREAGAYQPDTRHCRAWDAALLIVSW